jgi:hypothetical protein
MAEAFKRITYAITDTLTEFYTTPAGTTAIVIGCQVANVTPSSASALTLALDDGVADFNLVEEVTVPANAALNPIAGKLVLEAGDELKASATASSELVVVLSVLEQS